MKRYSASLIIREMHIKTTMKYHLIPSRMAVIKKSKDSKWGWGGGEKRILVHWWECKLVQSFWKTTWKFLKKIKTGVIWLRNPTSSDMSKGHKITILKRYLCAHVYCSTTYSIQGVETTYMSIGGLMDMCIYVHIHTYIGILFSL